MKLPPSLCLVALLANAAFPGPCRAAQAAKEALPLPFVCPIFGDDMVFQRDKPNAIWGWSTPGDVVRVDIQGHSGSAVADAFGRWSVFMAVPPVGGPYEVQIHGQHQDRVLRNVLVGDVWLCGGQSNMYLGVGATRNGAQEIKTADHPDLRLFIVGQHVAYAQAKGVSGAWKVCSPKTLGEGGAGGFSAVAYYFARRLQDQLHVPVGLVEDCVGGSTAESWMSTASLAVAGEFRPQCLELERLRAAGAPEYGSFLMHWLDKYDVGLKNEPWFSPGLPDADWAQPDVPGEPLTTGVGMEPGVCWFRRDVTLTAAQVATDAKIFLGSIDKMDTTYVNGAWVGASSWVENPRAYRIPAALLKPGTNLIAVRVFTVKPIQGFLDKPEVLRIQLGDGTSLPLSGKWKARVSVDPRAASPLPLDLENYATMPSVFHEGMIAPLTRLALSGVIWYQGEANTAHAVQYRALLPALISDWRTDFGQSALPFYIVSLPAYMKRKAEPGDDGWAELREAQAFTAAHVSNSLLAVTIDTGEADNIHPKDKKVVGERLALCALQGHYKVSVVASGPTFSSLERLPGSLRLHFQHTDGGLVVHGTQLGEFSLAGEDGQWHWADARIVGDSVVVASPLVRDPVAARYAWQGNPLATLFNGAGLPAGPFRTDSWELKSP
jgi:sialate O-acetylesterase